MTPKTLVARLFDVTSLVASNAFTACAAAVIAFDTPIADSTDVLFPADELATYALIALLIYEGLAFLVWIFRFGQVRILKLKAGYKLLPRFNEESSENISDPVLRMRVRQAEINYYADMQSVCLGIFFMAAGIIAAMYLSNTGITPDGLTVSSVALYAYLAPIVMMVVFGCLGAKCIIKSKNLATTMQKWVPISLRRPKKVDFGPGVIPGTVLFRASKPLDKWGKSNYKVIDINHLDKNLPPKDKRDGIVWTFISE